MISLLKNQPHYSSIFFLEQFDFINNKKYFIKSSSSPSGIMSISRELKGIDWYNSKTNNVIKYEISARRKNYIRIKLAENKGSVISLSKQPYFSNIKYIDKVIDHYCLVWGCYNVSSKVPLHGDLSLLGNIIFIDNEIPVIIDWEHFNYNSVPMGFDAISFLFEILWFQIYMTNNICEHSLNHLSKTLLRLKTSNCLNQIFIDKPLKTLQEFILNNHKFWGRQIKKLPVTLFNMNQVQLIDNLLLQKHD